MYFIKKVPWRFFFFSHRVNWEHKNSKIDIFQKMIRIHPTLYLETAEFLEFPSYKEVFVRDDDISEKGK